MERPKNNVCRLNEIRFRLDNPTLYNIGWKTESNSIEHLTHLFCLRHVRISEALFPSLFATINKVLTTLCIRPTFQAFVSADESINAYCISSGDDIVIWLSSGLIKTLEEDELAFVVGHEIGHWHFKHHLYDKDFTPESPKFPLAQSLSRAAEISADRAGLMAVEGIETALRAIIKTASGLPEKYLGQSISEYLGQARELKGIGESKEEIYASHPPMVVRARALMWFSMSEPYNEFLLGQSGGETIGTIDKRVEKDLYSALGVRYEANRHDELQHHLFWLLAYRFGSDGELTKTEQKIMRDAFGPEHLRKFLSLFGGLSRAAAVDTLVSRARDAEAHLAGFAEPEIERFLSVHGVLAEALQSQGIDLLPVRKSRG